jgi:hypothetical protein
MTYQDAVKKELLDWGKTLLMAICTFAVLGLLVGVFYLATTFAGIGGFLGVALAIVFAGRVVQRKRESFNG